MPFRIVETKLDPASPGRVTEKSPLPQSFASEALAFESVTAIVTQAAHGGFDEKAGTWWAHTVSGEMVSYAIEADEASEPLPH